MRILFFGDVVGEIGLHAIEEALPSLRKKLSADFVIVNGENTCKGSGLTHREYKAFLDAGVDCITLGNHFRGRDQIDDYIDRADSLIRPLNLRSYVYGSGTAVYEVAGTEIQVTNLLGQAFMKVDVDDPYSAFEDLLEDAAPIHIVDFHADSTSEKKMFFEKFKGRCTAVIGTHTHVQTADETIREGTGFLTDAGYCGMKDGIIGYEPASVIRALIDKKPGRFEIASEGPTELDFVVIDVDDHTGTCRAIEPVRLVEGKEICHVTHHL